MRTRLDELPVFETRRLSIRAEDYNLVHIALKRLGNPIRFELPRLRTLDFILEKDAWIVAVAHRQNLHEPVACERRTYHTHALLIVDKVFEAMHLLLGERIDALPSSSNETIVAIKKPS
jgi:hypothetical protein